MKRSEKTILLLFGVVIYFPLFLHLDHGALYRWDEATNAFQAYEMLEKGNFLRRFFHGNPDTWETKPPLLTWIQAIFMKLFGYNELAIRLPSALAALGTIGLILRFLNKELNNIWAGIFAGIVLVTSNGYLKGHVARTGDHDALLIFFLVAGLIYFYKYLHGDSEKRNKYLGIFVLALIGGVMTKSIAGLYYAPGLLLFTLLSKKFIPTIRQGYFWLGVLAFFVVIGAYYLSAEYFYPGYLMLVWENELFPRFFNSASSYSYNAMPEPYHFTKILFTQNFKWYISLLPLSLFLVWVKKDKPLSNFIVATGTTALLFHLIISKGTYNSWYNAPLFPLLAILVGAGLSILFHAVRSHFQLKNVASSLFTLLFIMAIFFRPYHDIIVSKVYFKEHWASDDIYGEYFEKLRREQPALKDFHVYYEVINRHFLFYENVYNDQYGYQITSCGAGPDIINCPAFRQAKVGSKVMICNEGIKNAFHKVFVSKAIGRYKACELYLIEQEK